MAVGVTLTPAQVTATSGTTVTVPSVAPTGTGRVIIANYSASGASGVLGVSTLRKGSSDFNGTPLWEANDGVFNSGGCRYLIDPTTASENVVITFDGTTDSAVLGITAFENVDTAGTPLGTPSSATFSTSDPAGISISTSIDDYVFGGVASNLTVTFNYQGTGTEQDNDATTYAQAALAYDNEATTSTVEWGNGTADGCWGIMGGVNLNAASGGTVNSGAMGSAAEGEVLHVGAAFASADILSAGEASHTQTGASLASGDISAAGEAAVATEGAALATGDISIEASAAAAFVGAADASAAGDMAAAGEAEVAMIGASSASGDIDSQGEAAVALVGTDGATTPTVTNVSGTVETGQELTITGTNMVQEDTTGYDPDFDASEFSFEGASFNDDDWDDGAGISYITTSGVPLMGSQAARWAGLQTSNPGGSFGPGSPNRNTLSATAGNHFYAGYFRDDFDYGSGSYGDFHKIFLNYAGNYEFNANWQGTNDYTTAGLPYERGLLNIAGTNYGGDLVVHDHKQRTWHHVEVEIPGASPWTFRMWVDGELIIEQNGPSDPGMPPSGLQFSVNTESVTDTAYGLEEWIDGIRVSSQRIGLLFKCEIGDSDTYATANKVYQYPRSFSDTAAKVEADLTGLGAGPYYLYVTNHRGETSEPYTLETGASAALESSGEAAMSMAGAAMHSADIAAAGEASTEMAGASTATGDIDSAGDSGAVFASTEGVGSFSSTAEATMAMGGASLHSADIEAAGEAAVDAQGASTAAGDLDAAGEASVDMGTESSADDADDAYLTWGDVRLRKARARQRQLVEEDSVLLEALHKAGPGIFERMGVRE